MSSPVFIPCHPCLYVWQVNSFGMRGEPAKRCRLWQPGCGDSSNATQPKQRSYYKISQIWLCALRLPHQEFLRALAQGIISKSINHGNVISTPTAQTKELLVSFLYCTTVKGHQKGHERSLSCSLSTLLLDTSLHNVCNVNCSAMLYAAPGRATGPRSTSSPRTEHAARRAVLHLESRDLLRDL